MLRSTSRELRQGWQLSQHVTVQAKTVHPHVSYQARRYALTSEAVEAVMVGRRRTLNDPISQLRSQLAAEKKLENDKRTDDYERDGSNRPHNSRRTVSTPSFEQNYLRGRVERRLKMQKGWADQSPAVLLRKYLATDQPPRAMQQQTAAIRSMRLPIVLLQMHLRDQVKADPENNQDIADLLPSEDQWQSLMSVLNHNGHTQEDLDQYINILFSSGDEQRCERFLADDSAKPMFLLSYLLRRGSSFSQISTLDGMIRYFKKRLCDTIDKAVPLRAELGCMGRAQTAMQILAPEDFTQIVDMLAFHCRRIEPRRLMQLAEVVADFILRYEAKSKHPKETYHAQCKFFNTTLNAIASRVGFGPQRKSAPYVFMWEAQRTLLGMSGGLPEALLVDKNGFKAIRAVLAGLPKNRDEAHSARRHSQSWPPYLQPGDGMDEVMEPDESWTRVVRAGMMMQEAGFPKGEVDVALDTLQGLAQDGTPTIQQRRPIGLDRNLTAWAASIMATRNANEAWERFKHPPETGMKAGPAEFGAMFQRLFAREIDADDESLPGDTSLNYPTQKVLNLTELEKSRLQPPTPAELYEMMRREKIRPDEQCLIILLSNADSLIKAHRYLVNGSTYRHSYLSLTSSNPTQDSLKSIPLPVFSAYIDVCSRVSSRRGRSLLRAIRLIELRLTRKHQNWASYIWEPILKNLGQHHHGLGISLTAQLRLLLQLVDRIDATHGMTLALFNRFTLSLRKILRREVEKLSAAVESNSADLNALTVLYGIGAEQAEVAPKLTDQDLMALSLIRSAGSRMKALFYGFVIEERERAQVGELNEVSWLDNMRARRDPVMAPNAHELMLALAFAGEFEEMASVIKWLMREWSPKELQEELENLEELPRDLDMLETLCVFRAFAEPMITTQQLDTVLNDFNKLEIHWEWPDDTTVKGYLEGRHHSNSNRELSEVLGWIRRRRPTPQAEQDGQGPEIADPQPDWTKIKREALGPQEVSQEDIRKRVYGID